MRFHMNDGFVKNFLRSIVKLANKRKHDKYIAGVKRRGESLPEFTLYSSDCISGLIYHALGRKFLSPTINMSIPDAEFLKLMADPSYYFQQPLQFDSSDPYPVGHIGEEERRVNIRFEHYKTTEDAENKWNERKNRVCPNVFIIMADQDLSDEQIAVFRSLKATRKVMFTWNKSRADGKEIFCVKPYGRKRVKNYSKIGLDSFRDYERFFDYVAWLNMEEEFMLEEADD